MAVARTAAQELWVLARTAAAGGVVAAAAGLWFAQEDVSSDAILSGRRGDLRNPAELDACKLLKLPTPAQAQLMPVAAR